MQDFLTLTSNKNLSYTQVRSLEGFCRLEYYVSLDPPPLRSVGTSRNMGGGGISILH
jgi:hypothetical protein